MKRTLMAVYVAALVAGSASARDLEDLLEDKGVIDAVEANEVKAEKEKQAAPALPPLPGWVEKVTLSGEVRVRNESFFREGDPDRIRQRFRLRFGAKAKLNDETELGFRVASGTRGDPISSNQSFDEEFTFKNIDITNAYLKLTPTSSLGLEKPILTLMGGKFDVPTYVPTKMVLDGDLTPEGFFESVKILESPDAVVRGLSLNLGQWVFEEQSKAGEGVMYAFQGVANFAGGGVFWNLGVADYLVKKAGTIARARNDNAELNITNNVIKTDGTVEGGKKVDPAKFGTDAAGEEKVIDGLVSDFNMVNVGSDATIATGAPRWPLLVFGDYVVNTAAEVSEDTGWQFGAGIGGKKDPGDFNFTYAYQRLETDAVLSAFSDSDFGRDGGTNTEGHILQVNYQWLKNVSFVSTAWITEPIDSVEGRSDETDYRWQVDLIGKF